MIKFGAIIAAILVYFGIKSKKAQALEKTEIKPVTETALAEKFDWQPSYDRGGFLDELYKKHGQREGLDWKLLKAIAQVESNEDPDAKSPLDPSYGLMQILCVSDGVGSCSNKLNILDWPPPSKEKLYDADYSLHIGSQILSWNIGRYGQLRGIACYNHWGARLSEPNGPFPNQGYVDKVMSKYRGL